MSQQFLLHMWFSPPCTDHYFSCRQNWWQAMLDWKRGVQPIRPKCISLKNKTKQQKIMQYKNEKDASKNKKRWYFSIIGSHFYFILLKYYIRLLNRTVKTKYSHSVQSLTTPGLAISYKIWEKNTLPYVVLKLSLGLLTLSSEQIRKSNMIKRSDKKYLYFIYRLQVDVRNIELNF